MSYTQEFRLTSTLDADTLREEVQRVLVDAASDQMKSVAASDYEISQRAGTGAEPVIVVFASAVAYDIWSETILPALKARHGGAAAVAVDEVRET